MKTTVASITIALTLSACITDEGRDDTDPSEDRVVAETTVTLIGWLANEAASFAAGEVFGLTLAEESVEISDASIAEIQSVVSTEIQTAELKNLSSDVNTVVDLFNRYSRSDCTSGLTDEGECGAGSLEQKLDTAEEIAADARKLFNRCEEWSSTLENDIESDLDPRFLFASKVQLLAAVELVMMKEIFQLGDLLGHGDQSQRWSNYTDTATDYYFSMGRINQGYRAARSYFNGGAYIEHTTGTPTTGNGTSDFWRGCFDAPGGPDCGEEFREEYCTPDFWDCTMSGPSDDELLEKANTRRQQRLDRLEVIGAGGSEDMMNEMITDLNRISAQSMPEP